MPDERDIPGKKEEHPKDVPSSPAPREKEKEGVGQWVQRQFLKHALPWMPGGMMAFPDMVEEEEKDETERATRMLIAQRANFMEMRVVGKDVFEKLMQAKNWTGAGKVAELVAANDVDFGKKAFDTFLQNGTEKAEIETAGKIARQVARQNPTLGKEMAQRLLNLKIGSATYIAGHVFLSADDIEGAKRAYTLAEQQRNYLDDLKQRPLLAIAIAERDIAFGKQEFEKKDSLWNYLDRLLIPIAEVDPTYAKKGFLELVEKEKYRQGSKLELEDSIRLATIITERDPASTIEVVRALLDADCIQIAGQVALRGAQLNPERASVLFDMLLKAKIYGYAGRIALLEGKTTKAEEMWDILLDKKSYAELEILSEEMIAANSGCARRLYKKIPEQADKMASYQSLPNSILLSLAGNVACAGGLLDEAKSCLGEWGGTRVRNTDLVVRIATCDPEFAKNTLTNDLNFKHYNEAARIAIAIGDAASAEAAFLMMIRNEVVAKELAQIMLEKNPTLANKILLTLLKKNCAQWTSGELKVFEILQKSALEGMKTQRQLLIKMPLAVLQRIGHIAVERIQTGNEESGDRQLVTELAALPAHLKKIAIPAYPGPIVSALVEIGSLKISEEKMAENENETIGRCENELRWLLSKPSFSIEDFVHFELLVKIFSWAGNKKGADILVFHINRISVRHHAFVPLLKALWKVDSERGTELAKRALTVKFEDQRRDVIWFTPIAKELIQTGEFTKELGGFLDAKHLPWLQKVLRLHPSQFNTVLEVLSQLPDIHIEKAESQEILFKALQEMGTIAPRAFLRYHELSKEQKLAERKKMVEDFRAMRSKLFRNEPLSALLAGVSRDMVAEYVHLTFNPHGMSYQKVCEYLDRVPDCTSHLQPYHFPADGYVLSLSSQAYGLKPKQEIPHAVINQLVQYLKPKEKSSSRAFDLGLNRLCDGTSMMQEKELSALLGIVSEMDFFQSILREGRSADAEQAHNTLQQAQEGLDIWLRDNYARILDITLNDQPQSRQKLLARLTDARLRTLWRQLGRSSQEFPQEWTEQQKIALVASFFVEKAVEPLRKKVREGLKKFQPMEAEGGKKMTVRLYISKNQASFFAKAAAGICTAQDVELFTREDHFHMNMVDDNDQVVGNIQAYIIAEKDGKKSLLLRGFNPTVSFAEKTDAGVLCEAVLNAGRRFVESNDMQKLYITGDEGDYHALSNRTQLSKYLRRYCVASREQKHTMVIASDRKVNEIFAVYENKAPFPDTQIQRLYEIFPAAKERSLAAQKSVLIECRKVVNAEGKKETKYRDYEDVLGKIRGILGKNGEDGKEVFSAAEIEHLVNTGVFGEETLRVAAEERTALEGLVQQDVKVMMEKFRVDPGIVYRLGNVEILGKIAVELGVKVSDGTNVGKMQEEILAHMKGKK